MNSRSSHYYLVGLSVLRCLYQIRLGVLLNSSPATCTLKKFPESAIYPTMSPSIGNSD